MVAEEDPWADRDDFLQEVLVSRFEKRRFQTETINAMPLYPTETILWDENQIPNVHYTGKAFCYLSRWVLFGGLLVVSWFHQCIG